MIWLVEDNYYDSSMSLKVRELTESIETAFNVLSRMLSNPHTHRGPTPSDLSRLGAPWHYNLYHLNLLTLCYTEAAAKRADEWEALLVTKAVLEDLKVWFEILEPQEEPYWVSKQQVYMSHRAELARKFPNDYSRHESWVDDITEVFPAIVIPKHIRSRHARYKI